MALPVLTPTQLTSSVALLSSSLPSEVTGLPYGIYSNDQYFLTGCADQVAFTYHKLGGDVLEVELTKQQVWAAYEESVLEYSYLINMHQSKNVLFQLLGSTTGSFDSDGSFISGSALSGTQPQSLYPNFSFVAARKMGRAASLEAGFGGENQIYSASFDLVENQQDYDLQTLISSSAALTSSLPFYGDVGNKRINITKVFYRTPHAAWRFFGITGLGGSVYGNGSTTSFGAYSDRTDFQVIPVWEHKLQAINYNDSLRVRTSHYSYEIKNNKLRIFPVPFSGYNPTKMFIEFFVDVQPFETDSNKESGVGGVNNMNNLPFQNIPYQAMNSLARHWCRKFAVSLCKEMLGLIRGKHSSIPIPGGSTTLNHADLLGQAKDEQEKYREELKKILDDLVYTKLTEDAQAKVTASTSLLGAVPVLLYRG